jgi:hypothetical protein
MDTVSLIAIISASSALVVSILTHIKYSSCCGFKLRTTEGNESQPTTPAITTPLIQSQPIEIPKPSPIFNKINYL